MPDEPLLSRYYDNVLLHEAKHALSRAKAAKRKGDSNAAAGACFTAIIAAAAATEYGLSEILAHSADVRLLAPDELLKIHNKRSLWKKLHGLMKAWRVNDFHRRPIYQDYRALVSLRNAVIHRSGDFLEPGVWPDEITPFKNRIDHVSGEGLDWTSQILSTETAEWAVETAEELLEQSTREVPDPAYFQQVAEERD